MQCTWLSDSTVHEAGGSIPVPWFAPLTACMSRLLAMPGFVLVPDAEGVIGIVGVDAPVCAAPWRIATRFRAAGGLELGEFTHAQAAISTRTTRPAPSSSRRRTRDRASPVRPATWLAL